MAPRSAVHVARPALAALAFAVTCSAQQWPTVPGFKTPQAGFYAANSDLLPAGNISSAQACAELCESTAGCISFNLCTTGPALRCGVQGYNISYVPQPATQCAWYRCGYRRG